MRILDQGRQPPARVEALLIVEDARLGEVLAQAGELAWLTQRLPPRLAVIAGEPRQLDAVRNLPGVIGVFETAIPPAVLARLSPTEQLFVDAWLQSRLPESQRPADGLPWDAEGFEPP